MVNVHVVMVGIVMERDANLLVCNGGSIVLKNGQGAFFKEWEW